jgi:hypothetical protein
MAQAKGSRQRDTSTVSDTGSSRRASGVGASRQGSGESGNGGASTDPTQQGQEALDRVQGQASHLVDTAREQATDRIATQKDRVAGTLGVMADALHSVGRQMREQDEDTIGQYMDTAADQVNRVSAVLRDQDISQLIAATSKFARQQPGLFLAASFAIGFAGTRFLRSSASSQSAWQGSGWDPSRRDWTKGASRGRYSPGFSTSSMGGSPDYGASASSAMGMGPAGTGATERGDMVLGSEWPARVDYEPGPEGS